MSKSTETVKFNQAEVTVTYHYEKAYPGKWTLSNGDPGYPDEPAYMEILKVEYNGQDVTPSFDDRMIEELEELMIEKWEDQASDI